jgi:hypothetical protein
MLCVDDARDLSQTPDFGYTADRETTATGSAKKEDTQLLLARATTLDCLHSILTHKDFQQEFEACHPRWARAVGYLRAIDSSDPSDTNDPPNSVVGQMWTKGAADHANSRFWNAITDLLLVATVGHRDDVSVTSTVISSKTSVDASLQKLSKWLSWWSTLHPEGYGDKLPESWLVSWFFNKLEVCKMTMKLLDLAEQASRNNKHSLHKKVEAAQLKALKEQAQQLLVQTRRVADDWMAQLDKNLLGVCASKAFEGACGAEVVQLVGETFAKDCFKGWKRAALDTLGGIAKVRVP